MDNSKLIDRTGYIVSGVATFLCFLLFYYDTAQFGKSLAAALITGALVWATYMVLRWLIFAYKS